MSAYFIFNGPIHTMSEGGTSGTVEAMLVVGDRVRAVGSREEVRRCLPPGAEAIDLKGRSVFPGFHDSHNHLLMYAVSLKQIDLMGVATLEEGLKVVETAAEAAALKARPGEWLTGRGWDKSLWIDFPTRQHLDSVSGNLPVYLASKDGHSAWVNSRAQEMCGIGGETAAPEGGAILKDGSGQPTGIIQDRAMGLVQRFVPEPTPEFVYEALADCVPGLWKMGLTCIHAPDDMELFGMARRLGLERDLPIRVAFMPSLGILPYLESFGIPQGYGDDWVWTAQVKMFKDGSLGSSTAHLFEAYEGIPGYVGLETMTDQETGDAVRRCAQAGYGVAVHAIGDRAVSRTLDAIEASLGESRRQGVCRKVIYRKGIRHKGIRHRIEHAQMIHPQDIPRFRELGVIASVQPSHAVADRYMADREWGSRSTRAYPFGQMLNAGAVLALGSDAPVDNPDPIYGIYCATNRNIPGEDEAREWHPHEKMSPEAAVRGYTWGAAYAAGKEDVIGDLSPGKCADYVVVSQDILSMPARAICSAKVEAVSIGGRFVVPPEW